MKKKSLKDKNKKQYIMDIEKTILDFVKKENKSLEIFGLRGLVKSGENEWRFRFVYRDEDFLSVSKLFKIKLEGLEKKPIFITQKRKKKTKKNTVKQ
jgi:hypothetical protein